MNDFAQNPDNIPHRTELSGVLLESVEEVLREPIEENDLTRTLDRVRLFSRVTVPRRSHLSRRVLIGAVVATTIAVVALFILPNWRPVASVTWAEVVEAVAKKPWLHYVGTWPPDGTKGSRKEGLYSAGRAVEGNHYIPGGLGNGLETYTWIDYAKESETYYYPQANTIVLGTSQKKRWEHYEFIWTALLSGNLGGTIRVGRYEIVDQHQREIMEDGKRCIEYRFRWKEIDKETRSDSLFVVFVDPNTRLPFRLDLFSSSAPKAAYQEKYDYPDSGPKDIYALGAPKSAKIVDCSLQSNVEQLAKVTVAIGCREDVQFSALVVRSLQDKQPWGFRIWKKGLLWRIESSVNPLVRGSDNLPPKDTDQAEWWNQKAEKATFGPESVFDGKSHWQYSRNTRHPNQTEIDAGMDKDAWVVVSTDKEKLLPWPRDYYWEGEPLNLMGHPTTCHDSPPSGLPIYGAGLCPYYLATIDPKPKSGPPNTILLELRNPIWMPDNSTEQRWRQPQIVRFWIDPERDYLVMRQEDLITREGKEEIISGSWIESLTQNHQKQWFPTVVHNLVNFLPPDGNGLEDEILRFYYDFDAPMPDSLFEP